MKDFRCRICAAANAADPCRRCGNPSLELRSVTGVGLAAAVALGALVVVANRHPLPAWVFAATGVAMAVALLARLDADVRRSVGAVKGATAPTARLPDDELEVERTCACGARGVVRIPAALADLSGVVPCAACGARDRPWLRARVGGPLVALGASAALLWLGPGTDDADWNTVAVAVAAAAAVVLTLRVARHRRRLSAARFSGIFVARFERAAAAYR